MDEAKIPRMSGHAARILKNVSRTLYLSIKILPGSVKAPMGVGYMLCRAADTVADASKLPAAERLEIIRLFMSFRDRSARASAARLLKAAAPAATDPRERELLAHSDRIIAFMEKLPPAAQAAIAELTSGVAAGMQTDLEIFPSGRMPKPVALRTAAELERYCARIGGAPGVFWARLYRDRLRELGISVFPSEESARMIGSALQITNILRDLPRDLRAGRCYLPEEELNAAGLTPEMLLDPARFEAVRPVVRKWLAWAVDQLDLSESFLASVPKTELGLRAAVIWPVYWAMDTLSEIARANVLDPSVTLKIRRSRIYATILKTPPLLLSNTAFARGYRFRRETLIVGISGGNDAN